MSPRNRKYAKRLSSQNARRCEQQQYRHRKHHTVFQRGSRHDERREPKPLHNDRVVEKHTVAPGALFHIRAVGTRGLADKFAHERTSLRKIFWENRRSR